MANATKVTINSLAVNTVPTTITESVLDTGTDAVTLPLTPDEAKTQTLKVTAFQLPK